MSSNQGTGIGLAELSTDALLRLAEQCVTADRTPPAKRAGPVLAELRRREVTFDRIAAQTGIRRATAHRWWRKHMGAQAQEQGEQG